MSPIRPAELMIALGAPSILTPGSSEAAGLSGLTRILIGAALLVYLAVMGILIAAVSRDRSAGTAGQIDMQRHSQTGIVIGGALIPAVILVALFLVGLGQMRTYPAQRPGAGISYQVTGHQWWWDIEYQDPELPGIFHSANELHVPVGVPVSLTLVSADVIHSFWVPELQGKMDLIPGDTNQINFVATRAGTYEGVCAEYCGTQHANMKLVVVAEPPGDFDRWLRTQQDSALAPTDSVLASGAALVTGGPCALCHTIRGTPAQGKIAPDLTHLGARHSIGAGLLPNNVGTLAGWIANAQELKPGIRMPSFRQFTGDELRAMAAYLASLK